MENWHVEKWPEAIGVVWYSRFVKFLDQTKNLQIVQLKPTMCRTIFLPGKHNTLNILYNICNYYVHNVAQLSNTFQYKRLYYLSPFVRCLNEEFVRTTW